MALPRVDAASEVAGHLGAFPLLTALWGGRLAGYGILTRTQILWGGHGGGGSRDRNGRERIFGLLNQRLTKQSELFAEIDRITVKTEQIDTKFGLNPR